MSNNESEHIEGLINGSYKDFQYLYDTYATPLYGFVFKLTRSESMTKEIVQDTFVKLWINREQVSLNYSFKSYLFQISKNQLIDEFRRQVRNPLFEDYMAHCENAGLSLNDVEERMDFDQFQKELLIAKNHLTPGQRRIFELNKEQGLTASEIAKQLDISEQSVYNQLSNALSTLRIELKGSLVLFALFFN